MKHYPNQRPTRLIGLEHSIEISRGDRGPSWRLFWRTLAMGAIAASLGFLAAYVAWSLR